MQRGREGWCKGYQLAEQLMPTSQSYRLTRPMAVVNLSYPGRSPSVKEEWVYRKVALRHRSTRWKSLPQRTISCRKAPVGFGSLCKLSMISFQAQQTYMSSCPLCLEYLLSCSPKGLGKSWYHWCRDHMLRAGAEISATANESSKCHHVIIISQKI